MTFGLLQCDHVDDHNRHLAGDYNDMFASWLPGEWRVYDLTANKFPARPDECDAWVSTGSHCSVYDDVPWIHRFAQLVRDIDSAAVPFVGVCFGHQMMAHALGGRVTTSPRGWSIGVHQFAVHSPEPWMQPALAEVSLLMSCQDQVDQLPPDSTVLASSDHCPVAIYRLRTMLGVQAHPEWPSPYAAALLNERIGEDLVQAALATLDSPRNSAVLSKWAHNWIRLHANIKV